MRAVSFMNIKFGVGEEVNVMADPDACDDYLIQYSVYALHIILYTLLICEVLN